MVFRMRDPQSCSQLQEERGKEAVAFGGERLRDVLKPESPASPMSRMISIPQGTAHSCRKDYRGRSESPQKMMRLHPHSVNRTASMG